MKKTFRFIGMVLMVVLLSVNLMGCSDDDEEVEDDMTALLVGKWKSSISRKDFWNFKKDGLGYVIYDYGTEYQEDADDFQWFYEDGWIVAYSYFDWGDRNGIYVEAFKVKEITQNKITVQRYVYKDEEEGGFDDNCMSSLDYWRRYKDETTKIISIETLIFERIE